MSSGYINKFTVDLDPNIAPPIVFTKQGDTNREFIITITKDGEIYDFKEAQWIFRLRLPNKNSNGQPIYKYQAVDKADVGKVRLILQTDFVQYAGRGWADLAEIEPNVTVDENTLENWNNLNIISTASFILHIQESPIKPIGYSVQSSDLDYLKQLEFLSYDVKYKAQEWVTGYYGNSQLPSCEENYEIPGSDNNAKYYAEAAASAAALASNYAEAANNSLNEFKQIDFIYSSEGTHTSAWLEQPTESNPYEYTLHYRNGYDGNALFVNFDIDYSTGQLMMYTPYKDVLEAALESNASINPNVYFDKLFRINDDGILQIGLGAINGQDDEQEGS